MVQLPSSGGGETALPAIPTTFPLHRRDSDSDLSHEEGSRSDSDGSISSDEEQCFHMH